MNLSNMLQEFITQIMDSPNLSGYQQEEKMIQVFDLCHFIDVYKPSLKIIDYKHKINIVDDDGVQKGIYFCDLLYNAKYSFDGSFYIPSNVSNLVEQLKIKELWFVVVEESFYTIDLTISKKFVKSNNTESLFDKIFYFNFSQSIIKILK
jgi:hypothetical protein